MNESDLLKMKTQIADAKTKKAELSGKLELYMHQLSTNWSCKTIPAADKKLEELEEEVADIKSQIETGLAALEGQL